MLTSDLQEHVIYSSESLEELIFAMNAQKPGNADKEVAEEIRRIIIEECKGNPLKIPLRWYLFLQQLIKMTEGLKRKVLKKSECFQIASTVGCDVMSCEAALEFFSDLNQLFYFPYILPGVVFVDPMVLIDKITELVFYSYQLCSESKSQAGEKHRAMSGEWKKFRNCAQVSKKILKKFPKHYCDDVFTPNELIKLLRGLLVFGDLSEEEWFMPSLLGSLCKEKLRQYCTSGKQAMAIRFPGGGPQNGMFCSLISYLLSQSNTYTKQWKLVKEDEAPQCLYINCAKFTIPDSHPGEITIIDQFSHFEVHLNTHLTYIAKLWHIVRHAVFAGLEKASAMIGYNNKPEPAIICTCPMHKDECHLATVDEEEMVWACTERPSFNGNLSHDEIPWLHVTPGQITPSHIDEPSCCLQPSAKYSPPAQCFSQASPRPTPVLTGTRPALGLKPTLSQLNLLKSPQGERIEIIKNIAPVWKKFGICFDFDPNGCTLDLIHKEHQYAEDCCIEMMKKWLEGKSKQPATWATMIELLKDAEKNALAHQLEELVPIAFA